MGRSWTLCFLCWYKRSQWFKECTDPKVWNFVECLLIHPNSDLCGNDRLFLQIVLVVDKDAQKLTLQTGSIFNERAYCAFLCDFDSIRKYDSGVHCRGVSRSLSHEQGYSSNPLHWGCIVRWWLRPSVMIFSFSCAVSTVVRSHSFRERNTSI